MRKKKIKKKKHRWLRYVSLVIVLLAVLIGGYALYELKFKTYDVADEAVEEIVEDNYVIELPDGSEITVDSKGNILEQSPASSNAMVYNSKDTAIATDSNGTSSAQNGSESNSSGSDEGTSADTQNSIQIEPAAEKPTVKTIKAKYTPTLRALETQASTRLNELIGNAKAEFANKRANGESISIGYFYNKYMGAANSLEASTDAAFNGVMAIIEKELETNGFDKSHTQSLRDEYEASKKALRESLLSEVKNAL